jgi:hypothetical protein
MDRYCVAVSADQTGAHTVHTSGCPHMPAECDALGEFESRTPALSKAKERYANPIGCVYCTLDDRFYRAALDGLKSFRHMAFTVEFVRSRGLRVRKTLRDMWDLVEEWMAGTRAHCMDLLEYVDDLKLWGRQYVFLFEVEDDYVETLDRADFIRSLGNGGYEQPIYVWDVPEPRLVHVRREQRLLIFKLVEMRTFDLLVDDTREPFEERATNFFVVDLDDRHAELRLQELPVGAHRNVKAERDLLLAEIGKHVDLGQFRPVELEPVMTTLIRRPIYPITSTRFRATKADGSTRPPGLLAVVNSLFKSPVPSEVNARFECDQHVLGRKPLYFRLNGRNDYVEFDGIADPARVKEVLDKLVTISREPVPPDDGGLLQRGLVGRAIDGLEGQPIHQAIVLSAGAIAAALIWIVVEASGNYLFEKTVENALGPVPLVVITVAFEIAWTWLYYGSRRIRASFRALFQLPWRDIWGEIMAARRRAAAAR